MREMSNEEIWAKALENEGLLNQVVGRVFRKGAQGLEFEDLKSAGWEGLYSAVSTFDPDKGYRFSTYASTCIFNKLMSVLQLEIAAHGGSRGRGRRKRHAFVQSLDEWLFEGDKGGQGNPGTGAFSPGETRPYGRSGAAKRTPALQEGHEDEVIRRFNGAYYMGLLLELELDERSRDMVMLRLDGWSLNRIGEKYGVTRERVRQVEKKVLNQLRSTIQDEVT